MMKLLLFCNIFNTYTTLVLKKNFFILLLLLFDYSIISEEKEEEEAAQEEVVVCTCTKKFNLIHTYHTNQIYMMFVFYTLFEIRQKEW